MYIVGTRTLTANKISNILESAVVVHATPLLQSIPTAQFLATFVELATLTLKNTGYLG